MQESENSLFGRAANETTQILTLRHSFSRLCSIVTEQRHRRLSSALAKKEAGAGARLTGNGDQPIGGVGNAFLSSQGPLQLQSSPTYGTYRGTRY